MTAPPDMVVSDPRKHIDDLVASSDPFLIGVRHHSPALSVVLPDLLDAAAPDVLLVELPSEAQPWLEWLSHPDAVAPLALAGAPAGGPLAFYPFAAFSPELVALRWARQRQVHVFACDLPLADRNWTDLTGAVPPAGLSPINVPTEFGKALASNARADHGDDLWDRLVEARAPGASADRIRRAALAVGWALRADAESSGGVSTLDLAREAHMRAHIAAAHIKGQKVAAIIGAFHAEALLVSPAAGELASGAAVESVSGDGVVTSLIPYSAALLDSRSGYPAGIRDPAWQQWYLDSNGDPEQLREATVSVLTMICKRLRALGHPAGPAEASEATRVSRDLASLRGLPAPGRAEIVEAMTSVFAQGDIFGRGRSVARAAQDVLVGSAVGALAPGTPRSGLIPAVEAQIAELRLPGPDSMDRKPRDIRLDPLRSDLDRRRHVTLMQLTVCGISYAEHLETVGLGGVDAITSSWSVAWTVATPATIAVAALRGATLEQAADGTLRAALATSAGDVDAEDVLALILRAAEAGLVDLLLDLVQIAEKLLPTNASLASLLTATDLMERIGRGQIPGIPRHALAGQTVRFDRLVEDLLAAAVREVDGLVGSTEVADARTLAALCRRDTHLRLRLLAAVRRLARDGSPLMQGAAGGVLVQLGDLDPVDLGVRMTSWLDGASGRDDQEPLRQRVAGVLVSAGELLECGSDTLDPLAQRIEDLADGDFLRRLPALRGGFDVLSPADRSRVLQALAQRHGENALDLTTRVDPQVLMSWARADNAGWAALAPVGLVAPAAAGPLPHLGVDPSAGVRDARVLAPQDRWRLVLGREPDLLPLAGRRMARSLDELYGVGRGEGSRGDATAELSGGSELSYPSAREWADELAALFGVDVREEVLAAAAAGGRLDAVLEIDPDTARPSVELLTTVLSLAGGLPEARLAQLRKLVARMSEELARTLATRLRPALAGLTAPRPTRRPTGRLDLARTLRANLATVRRAEDGTMQVLPERPVFRSLAQRHVDWHVVLVVDVSGSMETSTVFAALTAAVLAAVPSLSVKFIAFSTEVVDLTDHVRDPLTLLLEVSVGGGTSIARGLAYARDRITVPNRTLLALITDFEEGGPVGPLLAQVRALAQSGVSLLGCAALDDTGTARYSIGIAEQVAAAGMPVAAVSPQQLARWVAEQVSRA